MNILFKKYLQFFFEGLDVFILNLIFIINRFVFLEDIGPRHISYFRFWMVINISWILLARFGGLYSKINRLLFEPFFRGSIKMYFLWAMSILFAYMFFSNHFKLTQYFISITLILYGVGIVLNRFIYLGVLNYFKKTKHFLKRILILGFNEVSKKLATYLETEKTNTQLLGFVEDFKNIRELSPYPILADINHTVEISRQLEIHEIYSTLTPEQNKYIYTLMRHAELACIRFKLVPDLKVFIQQSMHIDYLYDMPILTLRTEPLEDIGNRAIKRAIDIVISGFVVVFLLLWMIPLIGLLIYMESPGPVFFLQARSGRNNKSFQCYKFRSMRPNEDANSKQATKNDSRITRVGKFLRKTSLDEFPQFLNVLRGDMSIVGPRPHMLKHTEDYSKIEGHYMVRQFLKPGITGWAQINGYRGEIINEDQIKGRVLHDIWYLENWSIWLDLKIIFQTIYIVCRGDKNAY